jgi:hypothetical protein
MTSRGKIEERNPLKTCGQFVDRIYSTWPLSDVKECQQLQNAKKFLVAATFEKANTYVFAELVIMNPTL